MLNICRLCLCFGDNNTLKLLEVSVIKLKLLACFHIDITNENDELLPNQVCLNCIDKVENTFNFYNTVNKNQYLLNNLSRDGKQALENFYLHFITLKREEDEEINTLQADENKVLQSEYNFAHDFEIKSEKNDLKENVTHSPDKDISLSSIKKVKCGKHKHNTQVVPKTERGREINTLENEKDQELQNNITIKEKDLDLKPEDVDYDDNDDYSSDEEVSLSSIKKVKCDKHKLNTQVRKKERVREKNTLQIVTDQELQDDFTIKEKDLETKSEDVHYDDNDNNSSDDEVSLSSIKKGNMRKKQKEHKVKTVDLKITSDTKENIHKATGLDDDKLLNNKESLYKCLTCFQQYDSRPTLLQHYKKEHYSKNRMIHNIDNFISSEGRNMFKCTKCNKVFRFKKYAKTHLMRIHSHNRPFVCNLCGRTFKVVSEIINHARAHGGDKFCCSFKCGFSTPFIESLSGHEKRHKQEYKYKCKKCGKGFQVRTQFEQHDNVHTGARPFVCTLCGKGFHDDRHLTTHRSTVHPQSSALKSIICVHCSLPCDNKYTLKEHLCHEHGIKSFYLCDLCGKTFGTSSHLQSHKRGHAEYKRHKCSTCKKSFGTTSQLKIHTLIHTGVKDHACNKCGKRFTQQATLTRHSLRHATSP